MPTLRSLHLSGSRLTGKLPNAIGSQLLDLSIGENRLTGTFPLLFQAVKWVYLGAAYNKFTGVLQSDLTVSDPDTSSMRLEGNRYSGNIPQTLKNVETINILNGNIFTCGFNRNELPVHDPYHKQYKCGSNAFNVSIYVWIASVGLVSLLAVIGVRNAENVAVVRKVMVFVAAFRNSLLPNIRQFASLNRRIRSSAVNVTAIAGTLLTIVYVILTYYHHTYTHGYAWIVSAAFVSGLASGIVLLLTFSVVIFAVEYWLALRAKRQEEATVTSRSTSNVNNAGDDDYSVNTTTRTTVQTLKIAIMTILNFTTTTLVNGLYVYVTINSKSATRLTLCEIALAYYKLQWNSTTVPHMIAMIHKDGQSTRFAMKYVFIMQLFNTIIAPCITTAVLSEDCIYHVFVAPPVVTSSYSFPVCGGPTLDLQESNAPIGCSTRYETVSTSYSPPFYYSYQCSSALLTAYAPVYVYMFLLLGFAQPLVKGFMEYCIMRCRYLRWMERFLPYIHHRLNKKGLDHLKRSLFDKPRYLLTVYTHVTIFLTFGVVFPPLCFVIGVSLILYTLYMEFLVGRVISQVQSQSIVAAILDENAHKMYGSVRPVIAIICRFAAFFYSFFVFDTVGDTQGHVIGLVFMGVMIIVPYILQGAIHVYYLMTDSKLIKGGVDDSLSSGRAISTIEATAAPWRHSKGASAAEYPTAAEDEHYAAVIVA